MDPAASHMGETKTSTKPNNNGVNKSIFQVFNDLGAKSDEKRNDTCIALVQHLTGTPDDESVDNVPKNLLYCLKRLVRGLGGIRQAQQKGFFTALVGVLDTCSNITCEMFMETVDKELGSSQNEATADEKESAMGVVLAYGAAIRGGLFSRSSTEHQKHMIRTLLSCGKKKSYIPYASSTFLLDLIRNSDEAVLMNTVWPILKEEVAKPWEDQSLDSLMILMAIFNCAPNIVKAKTVQKWLGFPLYSPESMHHFAQKLVANSTALTLKHPIYDEFCRSFCSASNESFLQTFWVVIVDSLLFPPSKTKDHAALYLLTVLLKTLSDKQQIEALVTPRILDLIGRTLSAPSAAGKKFQEQCSLAREAITLIGNSLSTEDVSDKIRLAMLRKILFDSGNLQYEKQTGTHISILLENKLSKKSVQKLAKQFREVVDGTSKVNDQVWTNKDRKFAAQQLTRLIGHQACNDEVEWKVDQMLFLLHRGVFRQDSSGSVGMELAGTLRQCFFRSLDQKFSNIGTMVSVFSQIVQHINEQMVKEDTASDSIRIPFSSEASTAWNKMFKTVSQLKKKNGSTDKKESAEQIFHILFLFMGLQLISDPQMAAGALQELHSCYERVKNEKKNSKQSEEPQWVEVTIDLFLSLLSHDSHLLRTIVGTVFPHLNNHLSLSVFYQILEVLDPDQNENPLTSIKDAASDSDSESSSDDEESSNLSKSVNANGKLKHSQNGASVEEESDEGSESDENSNGEDDSEADYEDIDDDDVDETINDRLREQVRLALGNAASLTDTESVDLDDIDEEEGQRMDAALAQAFKTLRQSRRSKKSKKQKKDDEAVMHFRNRVLDLVEIYISKEPSMDICVECINPLLSLLTFSMKDVHQKSLETRTRAILQKLTGLKKFSSVHEVDDKSLAEQIKSLAVKGVRSATTFLGLSDLISDCCTFLIRCSEFIKSHTTNPQKSAGVSPVADVYGTLLVDFFTKRETLLPNNMFKSALSLQWSGCWCLAPLVVQYAFDSKVRPFRRGQAVELLSIFFRNNHLLNSADKKQKQSLKKIVASIVDHTIGLLGTSENDGNPKTQLRLNNHYTACVLRLLNQILARTDSKPADLSVLSSTVEQFCLNCGGMLPEMKKVLRLLHKHLAFDVSILNNVRKAKKSKNEAMPNDDSGDKETTAKGSARKKSLSSSQVNGILENTSADDAKQRKSSVPKGKSKKDKKLHRIALMGEGLESVTFSSVSDNVLNGMEPDDEDSTTDISVYGKSKLNGFSKSSEMSPAKRKSPSNDTHVAKKKKKNA